MVRLLLEDVTLIRDQPITPRIRFKGGGVRTMHLPLPSRVYQRRKTGPAIVAEIDRLSCYHHLPSAHFRNRNRDSWGMICLVARAGKMCVWQSRLI